ncbi:MAG: hypothetical protein NZ455_15205 [Bacteroidia bacterium]|nr:hypothetical protein [Bacteroidia bacterium]MDW8347739.1 hypothetical protein [Bacteroidia bacterium]
MSYLKNFLSVFNWSIKEKQKNEQKSAHKGIKPTVFDIKNWITQELPPLAWERIVLRSSKYLLEHYQKTLNQFPANELLPLDVQEKIRTSILQVYQKDIQFENIENSSSSK